MFVFLLETLNGNGTFRPFRLLQRLNAIGTLWSPLPVLVLSIDNIQVAAQVATYPKGQKMGHF